jgi:hypothetical protein
MKLETNTGGKLANSHTSETLKTHFLTATGTNRKSKWKFKEIS